jgi:aminoglycoside phosphotransferase (APT) family kinase protein
MDMAADADRATRRTQVVEALADAVATIHRVPPVHVAVDGLTGSATRSLADDLGRVLAGRGRASAARHWTRSASSTRRSVSR